MEKEIKISVLNAEGFAKMLSLLPAPYETVEQVNYYFDTPRREYAAAHSLLRLRKAKGKFVVTFKRGKSLDDGYFQALEEERAIGEEEAMRIIENPAEIFRIPQTAVPELPAKDPLQLLGSAVTTRSKIRCEGFIVEADEVRFPDGGRDYELEVETENPERVRTFLFGIMEENKIPCAPQRKTKYERFLDSLPGGAGP